MSDIDYSYIGKGKWYAAVVGASALPTLIGNVSAASFAVTEDTKELQDYTSAGGGLRNSLSRVSAVNLNLTASDYSPQNFAKMLRAAVTDVVAAAVTGEAHTVYQAGGLVRFDHVPATSPEPTVASGFASATTRADSTAVALGDLLKPAVSNGYYYQVTTAGTTDASVPTLPTAVGDTVTDGTAVLTVAGPETPTAGTHYNVTGSGIELVADTTLDGETWTVAYTKATVTDVQALVHSGYEYEFTFEGLNEARSGKRNVIVCHRVTLSPAQQLALISDDYGTLELVGKLLKDTSKNGTTISQYFQARIEA